MSNDPTSVLTGVEQELPEDRVLSLLDEVGLELWQAPQGFWAIRVKPAVMATQPTRPAKRRRLEGRA
jgi:hypothetical protein